MYNILRTKRLWEIMVLILGGILLFNFDSPPTSDAQFNPTMIESDNPIVRQDGTWHLQQSPNASGGSYLYSSGSTADALTLVFYGQSVEIAYVENPNFGSFAIQIDNNIHRTVVTTNNTTTFNQRAAIQYLDTGLHILRIFPVDGVIAIDAFWTTPAQAEQPIAPPQQSEAFDELPTNIILIIGDGMGFEHIQASEYFWYGETGYFPFESFPHIAEMTVGMAGASWTDSAASATAMATGVKVNEGVLSMEIPGSGASLETIMEYLQPLGISTGLITTAHVASATPAAFVAHNSSRENYQQITEAILQTKPNLAFAGANDWMTPQTAYDAGYTVLLDRDSMLAFNTETATYVSGQFGAWAMPYEYDGYPSNLPHLFEMTTTALNILDNNPNGFLIVIENENTDSAGHINDIQRSVYETKAVADAVQSAIDWAAGRTDTLIIVTADHETGGLNVLQNNGQGNLPTVTWTSTNHSSRHVPIFAWGAGADRIDGVLDNTDIYRLLRGWEPVKHAGVTITPTDLTIPLTETDATYSIVLRTQPTANVSISIETTSGVTVDTNSITFNTSNWNIPRIVTVTVTNNGQISHLTTSSDKTYHAIYLIDEVNVTVGNFPNAPTNLQAASISASTIDLIWNDNSPDESAFHIERSTNGVNWSEIVTVLADVTTFQDTVICNTTYFYRARAFRSADGQFSTFSNTAQATTALCPLLPPADLSASPNGNTQIDLSWIDNSDDETTFHIDRSPDGSDWSEIATVDANITTFQDTVTCDTTYFYRVRAFRSADGQFSTFSNTAQATTALCPLLPPSDLSASPNGNTQIDLAWSDNSDDETTFHIDRSPDGIDWSEIATVPADTTFYQDTVTCDTTYFYRVRAFRSADGQFSTFSNTAQATTALCPLLPPSDLSASPNDNTQIDLAWSDNSDDETTFHIDRSPDGIDWSEIATIDANITTFQDTVTCNTTYFYRVRAFRSADGQFSTFSNTAQATTALCPLLPPSDLSASPNGNTQIDLAWSDNSDDETTFHIDRSPDGIDWSEIATVSDDITAFQDTVICDTTYFYRVRAFRSANGQFSTFSNTAQATTALCPLLPPSDLSASPNGNTQIDLSWSDNSDDETTFHIDRSPNGSDWSEIATVPANIITFQDTVTCDTTYFYRVRAFRSADGQFSTFSNTAQATTALCPLLPPSDLSASPNGNTQIDLSWTDNSTDETTFHIDRSPDGIDWSEIATVDANITTFEDTVICNTIYFYRVRAFRSADGQFSTYSNTSQVTTLNCVYNYPILIAPLNITIDTLDALPAIFEWIEALDSTWYHVYLSSSTSGVILDGWYQVDNTIMTCNDYHCTVAPDLVLSNGDYIWYIQGWGPNGYTQWTSAGHFTISMPAPNAVNKTAPADTTTLTDSNVTFTWDHDPNATWYQLWVSGTATWYNAATICTTTCSVTQSLNNSSYIWYVQAYGPGGLGSWGTGFTFTVAVPPPSVINKTAPLGTISSATPTFEWQHDTLAAWYQIWIGNASGTVYSQWHAVSSICNATDCSLNTGLTFIGDYTWYIRGWNVGGYGDWGTAATFNYTFTLIAPSGTVSGVNLTYQWDDLGTPTTWYHLWIGVSGGSTVLDQWIQASTICNGTTCSFPTSNTLLAGNYIWYVQPYGSYGYGARKAGPPFNVSP